MKLIGVGGYARSGKDTFVSIAIHILQKNGYSSKKYSFANGVKDDLDDWLKEKYGIGAWTMDNEEKKIIRPFLVAHGCGKRIQTEGKYWIDKVHINMLEDIARSERDSYQDHIDIAFVSDVRFLNEAKWLHEKWNGDLIHLRRYTKGISALGADSGGTVHAHYTNVYDPAPNEEELRNDPFIVEVADQRIEWENKGNLSPSEAEAQPYLQEVVFNALNSTKTFNGRLSL
jgi:hypothetical protein